MKVTIAWQWPLVICLALYVLSAAAIFAARRGYERRRRLMARIQDAVAQQVPDGTAAAGEPDDRIFAGVSPADVRRLPFEHRVPRAVDEAVARFLVSVLGVDRVVRTASGGRRFASRWKRIAAFRLLAYARPHDALPILAAAARHADPEVAAAAVATLGSMHEREAAEALVAVLSTGAFSPSRVATFLHRFPLDVPDLLRPLFSSPTVAVRYWVAVLARRYPDLPWIAEALGGLAGDPAPMVRKAAIQSLAILRAPATVAVARAALADPAWFVRAHAARALGQMGAVEQAGEITPLLASREWWVRQGAKEALVALGTGAEDAILACLSHPDRFARDSAAEILQDFGTFGRLLAEEATGAPGSPGRREVLASLAAADGSRIADAVVARLPEPVRGNARVILESIRQPEQVAGG